MNGIKKFIASFLIICVLASTLAVPLIYIDFELRQDYIAKVLCIEKDEPITVCGGQCFLADQLKITTEAQGNDQQNTHRIVEIIFFSVTKKEIHVNTHFTYLMNNYFELGNVVLTNPFNYDIFHPPRLV